MPLAHPAPDDAHAGEHHLHRVRNDMLSTAALEAVHPDGRHIEARTFVNPDCHIELFRRIPKGLVSGVVEHLVVVGIGSDETGAEAQFVAPKCISRIASSTECRGSMATPKRRSE